MPPLPRAQPAPYFPAVEGTYLDGTHVVFPTDLPAEANLLVVAFRDEMDPLADQWARMGETLAARYDGRLAALELPVVGHRLKALGDLATYGIRAQVEGEAERARTVPVFVKKKQFRRALGTHDASEVYVFLVLRSGKILWRTSGGLAVEAIGALEEAVASVLGPASRPEASAHAEPPALSAVPHEGEAGPSAEGPAGPEAAEASAEGGGRPAEASETSAGASLEGEPSPAEASAAPLESAQRLAEAYSASPEDLTSPAEGLSTPAEAQAAGPPPAPQAS